MVDATGTCCLPEVTLPSVLEGLREAAAIIDDHRRIVATNRAYTERFADGARVCGKYCYQVSHHYAVPCDQLGESCPIAGARASGTRCLALHIHHTADGEEHEAVTVHPLYDGQGQNRFFLEVLAKEQVATVKPSGEGKMVGRSPAFVHMLELVSRVADASTTVVLLGESGTGKDLVAHAIHALSPRASAPFVPLDCSGLTETLFESELFGHEKGSFTGAHECKRGLVDAANEGTLFLDEVGDIPLSLQVKLLRLLETGTFRRVGSVELRRSNFRLVCATHRDLFKLVEKGQFREDLYYRINAFPICLPTLRERSEDIPLLADCILERLGCARRCRLSDEALQALQEYTFPGNVRELHNMLERACLLSDSGQIDLVHLPLNGNRPAAGTSCSLPMPLGTDKILSMEEVATRYIRWLNLRFMGSRSDLADRLGISERTLYRRLREH
jgi:transcriptional regulator with PAS, ATPase and Fis domain